MKTTTRLAAVMSVAAALLLMANVGHAADAKPTGTAVISGKVTDSTGKPAANIKVSLTAAATTTAAGDKTAAHAAKDPSKKGNKPAPLATTMTDSTGAYKFDALPAGSYNVIAQGKGIGHGMQKVTLTDGQNATADITLSAPKKAPAPAAGN